MTSDEYQRMECYYEKNADILRSVHSVTIGVNLDALYQPQEGYLNECNAKRQS
jgi:hypothetical protein